MNDFIQLTSINYKLHGIFIDLVLIDKKLAFIQFKFILLCIFVLVVLILSSEFRVTDWENSGKHCPIDET